MQFFCNLWKIEFIVKTWFPKTKCTILRTPFLNFLWPSHSYIFYSNFFSSSWKVMFKENTELESPIAWKCKRCTTHIVSCPWCVLLKGGYPCPGPGRGVPGPRDLIRVCHPFLPLPRPRPEQGLGPEAGVPPLPDRTHTCENITAHHSTYVDGKNDTDRFSYSFIKSISERVVVVQRKTWRTVGLHRSIAKNGASHAYMHYYFSLVSAHCDAFIYLCLSGFSSGKKYETICSTYGRKRVRSFLLVEHFVLKLKWIIVVTPIWISSFILQLHE